MKNFNLLIILFFFFGTLNAATHTSIKSGNWNNADTWDTGRVPNLSAWPGDVVVINHKVTADEGLKFNQGASLTINADAALIVKGELKLQGSGTFLIASNGSLECENLKHGGYSGSFTVQGDLICKDDIEISGVAAFYTEGNIFASNLEIKGSGAFESNGGSINLSDDLDITGGSSFTSYKTAYNIEGSFERTGGPNIAFAGGSMSIGDDLEGSGGGSICFDGTIVTIGEKLELKGSVTIYIGGRGSVSAPKVELKGATAILGKDMGGWFYCEEMSLSPGCKIECTDGGCSYNDANDHEMPSALDLGASSVLPVELLYFQAKANLDGMLVVSWATAVEINNDYFTIERSVNGKDWNAIKNVKGAGNSDITIQYEWVGQATTGTVYYRLMQTDFDGSFSYSDIQSVTFEKESQFQVSVYPNPATEYVVIEGITADAKPQVYLVNLQGQQLNVSSIDQGANTRVDIPSQLPAGTYGLVIQTGQNIQTQRIVIQK